MNIEMISALNWYSVRTIFWKKIFSWNSLCTWFQNAMGSKMKTMISDVDHGHRVTALESGFTGLEDSMGQHQNDFNSKLVNSLVSMF